MKKFMFENKNIQEAEKYIESEMRKFIKTQIQEPYRAEYATSLKKEGWRQCLGYSVLEQAIEICTGTSIEFFKEFEYNELVNNHSVKYIMGYNEIERKENCSHKFIKNVQYDLISRAMKNVKHSFAQV